MTVLENNQLYELDREYMPVKIAALTEQEERRQRRYMAALAGSSRGSICLAADDLRQTQRDLAFYGGQAVERGIMATAPRIIPPLAHIGGYGVGRPSADAIDNARQYIRGIADSDLFSYAVAFNGFLLHGDPPPVVPASWELAAGPVRWQLIARYTNNDPSAYAESVYLPSGASNTLDLALAAPDNTGDLALALLGRHPKDAATEQHDPTLPYARGDRNQMTTATKPATARRRPSKQDQLNAVKRDFNMRAATLAGDGDGESYVEISIQVGKTTLYSKIGPMPTETARQTVANLYSADHTVGSLR